MPAIPPPTTITAPVGIFVLGSGLLIAIQAPYASILVRGAGRETLIRLRIQSRYLKGILP